MELNAEQIKKALECCQFRHIKKNCDECKYHRWIEPACRDLICQDALALINSQEQRIKELTENLHATRTELTRVQEENERLRAENEALAISEVKECEISQMLVYRIRDKHPAVMAVISDTVRKMQEALEQRIHSKLSYHGWYLKETVIAETAKELLESGDG